MAIDLKYNDFISVNINASDIYATFLVDTQADISIFKSSSLRQNFPVDSSVIIHIKGITHDTIDSMGTADIELHLEGSDITHEFHVVPDMFNIKTDGILGKDFLEKHQCRIDFANKTFTVNNNEHVCIFKINHSLEDHCYIIPPRSEVVKQFQIDATEDCVIENHEMAPGIFIARTIVDPGKAWVRVLNITEEPQLIKGKIENFELLSNFHCYHVCRNKPGKNRQIEQNSFEKYSRTIQTSTDGFTE